MATDRDADLVAAITELSAAVKELTNAVRGGEGPTPIFSNASAMARLAAVLLGGSEDGPPRVMTASQAQLALLCGLAEVTVQKLLRDLNAARIVHVMRLRIEILDPGRLRELADRK